MAIWGERKPRLVAGLQLSILFEKPRDTRKTAMQSADWHENLAGNWPESSPEIAIFNFGAAFANQLKSVLGFSWAPAVDRRPLGHKTRPG